MENRNHNPLVAHTKTPSGVQSSPATHNDMITFRTLVVCLMVPLGPACNACGLSHISGDGNVEPLDPPDATMVEGAANLCGNGVVEDGEECDDGNRLGCDGCSTECRLETDECPSQDAGSDDGMEGVPPDSPVPFTEPVPVEQDTGEDVHNDYWLHIMWTGEYFSFVYRRTCPSGPSVSSTCLGMRRFGKDGQKIGPDWVYTPTVPAHSDIRNDIGYWDVCWSDPEYGLAWIEKEFDNRDDSRNTWNAYFQRLNDQGKVIGNPVLLAGDIDRGCCPWGEGYPVRIGCSPEGYLVGYPLVFSWGGDVPRVTYTFLHELGLDGQTTGGEYFGEEDTDVCLWPESLKTLGGTWRLIHGVNLNVRVILENVGYDLALTWRTALLTVDSFTIFDMDIDEESGKTAVTFSYEDGAYFAIVDGFGNVDTAANILGDYQNPMTRIASLGSGLYAILFTSPFSVDSEPWRVEVIDESGAESEAVEVFPTLPNPYAFQTRMPADVVWTGEEIAVVALGPDPASGWLLPYLQLLRL